MAVLAGTTWAFVSGHVCFRVGEGTKEQTIPNSAVVLLPVILWFQEVEDED